MKKLLLLCLVALGGVMNASAATATTVYFAVPSRLLPSDPNVQLKVNYQGDNEWWDTFNMTDTGKTYYGLSLYKAVFTDKYDGLGCIQFLVGGNVWDQAFGIKEWKTPDVYNNKIWGHTGTSWAEYADDDAITPLNITYHVQVSNSWGYDWIPYKAYEYKGNANTTWTGIDTSANPWNDGWYDYTVVYPFEYIIFNDGDSNGGNGHQTGNIAIDNSQSEYWYTYTKNGEGNGVTTSVGKPANWMDDYERTGLTSGNFGTICLPFNATIEGATVFKIVSKVEDNNKVIGVNLESVSTLEAGKAYIFKATASTITATTSGDYTAASAGYGMMGNLSATAATVPEGNYVVKGNELRKVVGTSVTVGQYKGYVTLEGIGEATSRGAYFMGFDDEATGIESVQNENIENVMFNLQGQRVNNAQKGLVIVGGKKMIRK